MSEITIVGAGLVGCLQALYLAKKGYKVQVFESRPDMREAKYAGGRSINLALSDRGLKALNAVGAEAEIKAVGIPMYGRQIHNLDGTETYQPYGKENQAIYSVSRGGLNKRLLELADETGKVNFHFNKKCSDIDLENNTIHFTDFITGETQEKKSDFTFATDGAFSAVRAKMQRLSRFDYSQTYLSAGYKELSIKPTAQGEHQIKKNALHIWPRGKFMVIALPNLDGSFTCTLFLDYEGEQYAFEHLKTKESVVTFFKEQFPDLIALMPHLEEEFFENPTAPLVTIRCSPWQYNDTILLMGDASHAIVPFYGQGMNSGFEDCYVFNTFLEKHNNHFAKAIHEFSIFRKPDADAIADLALHNFIEMRDKTADKKFLLQKKIEAKLSERFPEKWLPLYTQVTFSDIAYHLALKNGLKQEEHMQQFMNMENIEQIWDSPNLHKEIIESMNW
ncbi:MAG: FAD-dependent oxidoreductase [Luteibaculaceae bacterium]